MPTPKSALRIEYLARRQGLPAATAAAHATAISQRVLEALSADCRCVGGYAAFRHEVPVQKILQELAARGIKTALPCVVEPNQPLVFRRWEPGNPLVKGPFNTEQPEVSAPLALPDVLLVPVLVFDRRGHRIGFGAGYYDRTLQRLREQKSLRLAIGVAYSLQESKSLPADKHDEKLNMIVTEKEIIRVTP